MQNKLASVLTAALALGALAAGPALAQEQAAPAQPQVASDGSDSAWIKICNTNPENNKETCMIAQELRTDQGQFLASLAIREMSGEARKVLLASVPVGMVINPGVQIQIDGGQATKAEYSICFPNACYAELAIADDYIAKMKKGGKMTLTTFNQQGKQVRFDMTLIGFTSSYDGEGMNPQEIQNAQQKLQQELEKKAQSARDALVAAQREAIDNSQSN